jgi:16S rRNA (guanine527-N7)-methyltransferase
LTAVDVVEARAEDAARRPDLREQFDAVVARSFGPPAVTAECAIGFLRPGAHLVVSEPPPGAGSKAGDGGVQGGQSPPGGETQAQRWPAEGLQALGFGPAVPDGTTETGFVRLEKLRTDDRWPRRVGIPAKRPVWTA